jgi:hypothetical protein
MKKNKNAYKLVAGALALVGIYFVYRYIQSTKKTIPTQPQPFPSPSPSPSPTPTSVFPLKKGSKGAKVKELQNLILQFDKKALPKFGADSDFGSETEAALVKLTGKKTINSQSELDALRTRLNKANFPYITPSDKIDNPIGRPLF